MRNLDIRKQVQDNTRTNSKVRKVNDALSKDESAQRRKKEIEEAFNANSSDIKEPREKQSFFGKLHDGLINPMTAASYGVKGEPVPDYLNENIKKGVIERNPLDTAVDVVNPFSLVDYVSDIPETIERGEYGNAVMKTATAIPMVRGFGKALGKSPRLIKGVQKVGTNIEKFKEGVKTTKEGIRNIINKKQIEFENKQLQGFNEGSDFVNNWAYPENSNTLRPFVFNRIKRIDPKASYDSRFSNLTKDATFNNLVRGRKHLVGSSIEEINKLNAPERIKLAIIKERAGFHGAIIHNDDLVVMKDRLKTFKRKERASPKFIKETSLHENAHFFQQLGSDRGFGTKLDTYDPNVTQYYYPNPDTEVGRLFTRHLTPHKGVKDKNWRGSVNELHAELMVSRGKTFDSYKEQFPNKTDEELINAIQNLENSDDNMLKYYIEINDLNRFFKEGTTEETKLQLLRYLPAIIGGAAVQAKTKEETTPSYAFGGLINTEKPLKLKKPTSKDNIPTTKKIIDDRVITNAPNKRVGTRKNPDGTESTHIFAQSDNVAFPMLYQNKDNSWKEYDKKDWKKAKAYAEKTGEIRVFKTEGEAQMYAKGSWKKPLPKRTY